MRDLAVCYGHVTNVPVHIMYDYADVWILSHQLRTIHAVLKKMCKPTLIFAYCICVIRLTKLCLRFWIFLTDTRY